MRSLSGDVSARFAGPEQICRYFVVIGFPLYIALFGMFAVYAIRLNFLIAYFRGDKNGRTDRQEASTRTNVI